MQFQPSSCLMPHVGIQHGIHYELGVVVGRVTVADYRDAAMRIGDYCREMHKTSVLVDLLGADPKVTREEYAELGNLLAGAWRGLRVALVVPGGERVQIGKQLAQASGLDMQTFTSLADAEHWLYPAGSTRAASAGKNGRSP